MSCCEPKKGLARVAEEPGMILAAYICALLPLAAIYALDFITGEWKSVRRTRRSGMRLLAISLPPLAVVIFYIHLQKLAKDYKEMATAITAAILCIWHILRTVWGLLQLHAFKRWNMHALRVLTRMGFDAPIYGQVQRDATNGESSTKSECKGSKVSFRHRICKCFSAFGHRVRAIFGFKSLVQLKPPKSPKPFLGDDDIARTVDNHMMVNSSLVDNEFIGADLPCRPSASWLLNGLFVSRFFACREPEKCAVRWTVSFLSRFGAKWLIQTKMLTNFKKVPGRDDSKSCSRDVRNRMAAFIAFHVTRSVSIPGTNRSQCVSVLSPHHAMCSDLVESWSPTLIVTEANAMPYQLRGRGKRKKLKFEDHAISIRNHVSDWPEIFLNELGETEQHAVSNMNPLQVACFSKLLEEQNSSRFQIDNTPDFDLGFNAFLCQLGYDSGLFDQDDSRVREMTNTFFGAFPVLKESLVSEFFVSEQPANDYRYSLLQASVHFDNWIALEAGKLHVAYGEAVLDASEDEFTAQKRIELRRLGLEVAAPQGSSTSAMRKVKFLGCIMESVRRAFASTSRDDTVDRKPSVDYDKEFRVDCSDQLNDALQWSQKNQPDDCRQRSVYMRMLWEIQLALLSSDSNSNHSSDSNSNHSLMVLCMLGYPALHISEVENCPQTHLSLDMADESAGEHDLQNLSVQSARCENSGRKYCKFKIDIVNAPQPVHIIFTWHSVSNQAFVQIGANDGKRVQEFYWESWEKAFMGRICAQSEWRAKCLRVKTETIWKESAVLTEGFSDIRGPGRGFLHWQGWPSFQDVILSNFYGHRKRIAESNKREADIDVTSSETECDCSCRGHKAFLQARELSRSGQENDAFELFGRCITHYGHSLALEQYVSDVVNKMPGNAKIVRQLLYRMSILHKSTADKINEKTALQCRRVKPCDLERIIELFDDVYEKTGEAEALYYQGRALFRRSTNDVENDGRCIEAFESYLALCDSKRFFGPSHLCLMFCYFEKHCSTRHVLDEELGMKHFTSYFQRNSTLNDHHGVDIAVLLGKGSLSKRDYGRINARIGSSYERYPIDQDLVRDIFLPSRYSEHRISRNAEVASNLYKHIVPDGKQTPLNHAQLRACNRLALMYHIGGNDFDKDLMKAKDLYERAIEFKEACKTDSDMVQEIVHIMNAKCNLAVWYRNRNPQKSVELFEEAVDECNQCRSSEPAEKHSASINNLAVITEFGKLVKRNTMEAKRLYRRSVDFDENPVAMYNLAVLLKFEDDPTRQNMEEAEGLLSRVADLGVDLLMTPVLKSQVTRARRLDRLDAPEISKGLRFDVEEIDDCLVYVKIIDSSRQPVSTAISDPTTIL